MRTIALIGICVICAVLFLYCSAEEKREGHRGGAILMGTLGALSAACIVLSLCVPI